MCLRGHAFIDIALSIPSKLVTRVLYRGQAVARVDRFKSGMCRTLRSARTDMYLLTLAGGTITYFLGAGELL